LILQGLNDASKRAVYSLQEFFTLAGKALGFIFVKPFYAADLFQQMDVIGVGSLGIVLLTGFFTGMVLALQLSVQLQQLGQTALVGKLITASMVRELGPVLAGLMVAGRVGSGIAAQLGSMRVTEQIDALTSLSTDPLRYLVLPRLIAGLVTMPVLVLVADIIGVFGGFLVGVYKLEFNPVTYLTQTEQYLQTMDVVSGLIKAAVFGFIIALMGCYHGYHSRGGAEGVGQATTHAVVSSSILILIFNYALTQAFFS
jgi:phospholipid/cholesterol/gamma-HCH transport system permease protein